MIPVRFPLQIRRSEMTQLLSIFSALLVAERFPGYFTVNALCKNIFWKYFTDIAHLTVFYCFSFSFFYISVYCACF